jgi:hypothetical protein
VQVGLDVFLLESFDFLGQDIRRAIHDLLHRVLVLGKLLGGGFLQLGQVVVEGLHLLNSHLQI